MKGWILYSKKQTELTDKDHGVKRLLQVAQNRGISLEVFTPEQFELVVTRDDKRSILIDDKQRDVPDFVIPRMGSHTTYFALAVIRQLEHLGVYSANSAATIECVRDKLRMHQLLAQSNLPTPRTMLLKFPIALNVVEREVGFPVVVKDISGMEGEGIYLSQDKDSLSDLMGLLQRQKMTSNIILQEFIKASRGKDLRVFVLGGKVIGCMKRVSQSKFKANFSSGGTVEPFELTSHVEWLAIETARLANLDIAGIDLLFDDEGEYKICEANSAPGFKGLEQVVGENIAEQIIDYILIKLGHTQECC